MSIHLTLAIAKLELLLELTGKKYDVPLSSVSETLRAILGDLEKLRDEYSITYVGTPAEPTVSDGGAN